MPGVDTGPKDKAHGPRPKVLLVDDEEANLELLVRILRANYDCYTAVSGQQALELLRKERFAAILSDQRMPGMRGTEFLTEARKLVPDTVRMILTGFSAEQDSLDAINLAAVSTFLTKPILPEVVARAVSDAVEVYDLQMRNRELFAEIEARNRELEEAKRLIEMSLDERTRQLTEANRRLEQLALRDPLTGLYNHRFLQERLAEEIGRQQRFSDPVSLILADIDHFRAYNEAHGHKEGDALLVRVAEMLRGLTRVTDVVARLRPTDLLARFGGEEFALIASTTPKEGALILCQRIRATIAAGDFPGQSVFAGGRLTMSYGIAEVPSDAGSRQELLEAAETALIRAKQGGRDRIETF